MGKLENCGNHIDMRLRNHLWSKNIVSLQYHVRVSEGFSPTMFFPFVHCVTFLYTACDYVRKASSKRRRFMAHVFKPVMGIARMTCAEVVKSIQRCSANRSSSNALNFYSVTNRSSDFQYTFKLIQLEIGKWNCSLRTPVIKYNSRYRFNPNNMTVVRTWHRVTK